MDAAPRLRVRGEARAQPYGQPAAEHGEYFAITRFRAGLGARVGIVGARVEVQDARRYGVVPGQITPGGIGVHQGYVEIVAPDGPSLRVGRQELSLGDQRLVGPLDWAMQARSFDAVRLSGQAKDLAYELFGAMTRAPSDFEGGRSRGDYLAGAQVSVELVEWLSADVYLLYRHDGPLVDAPTRRRDIASPGLRLHGAHGPLRHTFEGTVQLGDDSGVSHLAYALAGDLGYAFSRARPGSLAMGFAVASGASPTERLREVDNFFPTNHKFYGFADLFGLRNLVDGHVLGQWKAKAAPLTLTGGLFAFSLYDDRARWSDAVGRTLGHDAAGGARFLGGELDLTASYAPTPGLVLSAGYSLFAPAAGARRLGNEQPQHWAYAMIMARLE